MTVVIKDVSKTFPGQRALDRVSLTLTPGEIHALLGENGSGKSTLIRILAGYHMPDFGGSVRVGTEPLTLGSPRASAAAGLRFVHQRLALVAELSAVENVALEAGYIREHCIDWRRQAKLTRELLARLSVELDVWQPVRECRAVERTAIAIARALYGGAGDTVAVILDEPTASLPAAEVQQLFGLLRELVASGVAVLYVSHRLDEIFEIATRVSVLRDGQLVGTEPVAQLDHARLVEMIVGRGLAPQWERPLRHAGVGPHDEVLRVDDLTTRRLRGVSFGVRAGEVVGVVGVTGSGREEVASSVIGAEPLVSGTVRVGGQRLDRVAPRQARRAGLMLARGNTLPGSATPAFTVRENVTLGVLARYARFGHVSRRRERVDALGWIDSLGVRPREPERKYGLLSGGNQQKVILGKWLNASPVVLILEEPTAGVDVGARRTVYERIAQEAKDGLGFLLCSTDLEDIVAVADRALVLRDGAVAAELHGDELTESNLLLASAGRGDGTSEYAEGA